MKLKKGNKSKQQERPINSGDTNNGSSLQPQISKSNARPIKLGISKRVMSVIILIVVLGSIGFAGYFYYKEDDSWFGNDNLAQEQNDDPLTEEQLTQKINELDGKVDNSEGYEELGILYLQKGNYKLAIKNLNQAINFEEISDENNVYSALALSYYYDGQTDMAIKSYQRLIELKREGSIDPYEERDINNYKRSIDRLSKGLGL